MSLHLGILRIGRYQSIKLWVHMLVYILPMAAWCLLALLALDLDVCRAALLRFGGAVGVQITLPDRSLAVLTRLGTVFSNNIHPFLLLWLMWSVMALAMMLPTAARMLSTYGELAVTARGRGIVAPSVAVLAGGYLVVWATFALAASSVQIHANGLLGRMPLDHAPWPPVLAGLILIIAGAWQISGLKAICLTRCRQPFPVLFSRWRTDRWSVFRLGVEEGVYCLGCCWALMALMFAAGAMNFAWMAIGGVAMAVEKLSSGRAVPALISGLLIGVGCFTLLAGAQVF